MLELIKRLDFWLMIGALVFAIWLEIDKVRAWWSKRSVNQIEHRHGTVMSKAVGSGLSRPGADTGSGDPVPGQQNQQAPELVLDFEGVLDYLRRHNLTDDQAIDLLALARREAGDLMSANKIREVVGGNEAAVKARVASHRPKPAAPKPSQRLERPANGWAK